MQKIIRVVLLIALGLMVTTGGISCTEEEAKPTELLPVEVGFVGVEKAFSGQESYRLDLVFTVYNPNKLMVAMDELNYKLYCDEDYLGTSGVAEKAYIPGECEIRVRSPYTLGISDLIGAYMLGGMPMSECIGAAGAKWGVIGGDEVTWRVEGSVHITSELGPSLTRFDFTK